MFGPTASPRRDQFEEWFTDREGEQNCFRRLLAQPTGAITPIQSYVGVTGAGKTYLHRRFQQICRSMSVRYLSIELDPQRQGESRPDIATIVARMIAAFGLSAPRSAHALLHLASEEAKGLVDKAELTKELSAGMVGAITDSFIANFHSFSIGGLFSALTKAGIGASKESRDPLNVFLKTNEGKTDIEWFKSEPSPEDIRADLFRRFGLDIATNNISLRTGKAVQFAIFIDSLQCADGLSGNASERSRALEWITTLYRMCCTPSGSAMLTVITFSQNKVVWHGLPEEHSESLFVSGLPRREAIEYVQSKRGIPADHVRSILDVSLESQTDEAFHVFSLGLASDLWHITQGVNLVFSEEESLLGLPSEEILIRRFFAAVGEVDANRFRRLAQTPVWDDDAAAFAFNLAEDPDAAQAKISWLHRFSFVQPIPDGEFTLHDCLRRSLLKTSSDEQEANWQRDWIDHWGKRAIDGEDKFATRRWLHKMQIEGNEAKKEWESETFKARNNARMKRHLWLVEIGEIFLQGFKTGSLVLKPELKAGWYVAWACEAQLCTIGRNRLLDSVQACENALEVFQRSSFPLHWAMTQNNLGNALQALGKRESDPKLFERAVNAFKSALEVRSKEKLPSDWAMTQNNLGNTLMALGERENNPKYLREAVRAYREILKVYQKRSHPTDWAMAQINLGNVLATLGERENDTHLLNEAAQAFDKALEVYREETLPADWAMTQNSRGTVLNAIGLVEHNPQMLKRAVEAHTKALSIYRKETFPLDWARTQNYIGIALARLGSEMGSPDRLREAILAFRSALEIRTKETVPADWAETQNSLGTTLAIIGEAEGDQKILMEAAQALEAALTITQREISPFAWAMTKNNLGKILTIVGQREKNSRFLEEAIEIFTTILEVRKKDDCPTYWAQTQSDLGMALTSLGQIKNDNKLLYQSIQAYRKALEVRKRETLPLEWALTQIDLGDVLTSLGVSEQNAEVLEKAAQTYKDALVIFLPEKFLAIYQIVQEKLAGVVLKIRVMRK